MMRDREMRSNHAKSTPSLRNYDQKEFFLMEISERENFGVDIEFVWRIGAVLLIQASAADFGEANEEDDQENKAGEGDRHPKHQLARPVVLSASAAAIVSAAFVAAVVRVV